jgi:predicted HNH restriction endonuclease
VQQEWHVKGGSGKFPINQRWVFAKKLLDQSRVNGQRVPILFAPAEQTRFVTGWAVLRSVEVNRKSTDVPFENFRLLKTTIRKSRLKKSDGTSLNLNFIRPYAICATPKILAKLPTYDDSYFRIGEQEEFLEGESIRVAVNRYEREQDARAECIRLHGLSCVVCRMNFLSTYGVVAKGVIHVHHLNPMRHGRRRTDPKKDLVPVCPNCHAVIHLKNPPYEIAKVRKLLSRSAQPRGG